jgi:hypothetical protein
MQGTAGWVHGVTCPRNQRHRPCRAHLNFCSPAVRTSNRGYSTEILAAMTFAAVPGCGIADLLCNRVFMAGFTAWFIAQFAKVQSNIL